MLHKVTVRKLLVLASAAALSAGCDAPPTVVPPAPMDGIYTAVTIDDSAGPVRVTADPTQDLAISAATLDLRVRGRAILTTTMVHASDTLAPHVTFIDVFHYKLHGDSIATDSGGVGGRRYAFNIRLTMKYVLPELAGSLYTITPHTLIFAQ